MLRRMRMRMRRRSSLQHHGGGVVVLVLVVVYMLVYSWVMADGQELRRRKRRKRRKRIGDRRVVNRLERRTDRLRREGKEERTTEGKEMKKDASSTVGASLDTFLFNVTRRRCVLQTGRWLRRDTLDHLRVSGGAPSVCGGRMDQRSAGDMERNLAFIIYQPVLPDRDCVQSAERRGYLRRRRTRRHDVSSTYAPKTQREGSEPPQPAGALAAGRAVPAHKAWADAAEAAGLSDGGSGREAVGAVRAVGAAPRTRVSVPRLRLRAALPAGA
ncbi:hypothetical protein F7725_008974 [Dissostichus mawsoni]|uniref:Uncharacterized protein n=1 Tax=Dissostichus mawsoni TaxID=36200 RepID=A0A7J5Z5T1_DISMA|nr:hypothetical protein F7725_008974 [Dissostichus mawsoni]